MLIKFFTGIILGVCLGIASCSNSSSSDEFDSKAVVIEINGEKISADQFSNELKVHKKRFRVQFTKELKPGELLWLKNTTLQHIVKRTLLRQEAKQNNISVSQDELDEALLKSEVGYEDDSFNKQLEFEGISHKQWENIIKDSLLTNKLINNFVNSRVSVSDDEMFNYFESHKANFYKPEQVRALHIMVQTEEEIRQIQKELQSKSKSFSELAREYSLGPEGIRGGDLGYFEAGQMPEEFDNVFKLNTNGVSDIIRSPYGFHLFKVVDKVSERNMNFDESKKRVKQILLEEIQGKAFQEWIIKLKEKSVIEVKYDLLEKIN